MNSYYTKVGNGKPIVFFHGWGCDGRIYDNVVNRLKESTNYVVDFAGFGQSDAPPASGWDVIDYVNDIKQLFQEEHLENATIVAHSFGCRVAIALAATYPNYVDKMLLFAPAGLRKFSLRRWWKVSKFRCARFMHQVGLAQEPQNVGSADYLACSKEMKNTFVKVINQDLSFYAKRLKCETLIVNGNEDNQTPLSHAKRLNRMIKNSRLVEIDGDHFALFYAPTAFCRTIQAFMGIR